MTLITFRDGKPVMRDGLVGTGNGCCCEQCGCCGYCIQAFYDEELFAQGCPEGWTQDAEPICARYRNNVSECDCREAAFPVDCTALTPWGTSVCANYCGDFTPEPCPNEFP